MNDLNIYAFSDEANPNIDRQIEALLRNGLDGLEIRGVDGQNISNISAEKAKEVKKKLDDAGLVTWSIGSPIGKININDDFSAHKEKLKHTLETAQILNSDNMRIFSFYIPANETPAKYKNKVIEYLSEMCELAKPYNINLCHENEKGIYGDIPERCLELHKALPSLKGIFDPANYIQCGVDTLKGWEMLKEYIFYMHVKDAMPDGYVVPAGKGAGNLKRIVGEYIAMGGRKFTIEPHLAVFSGLEGLEREGERTKARISFPDNDTAFDAACNAFKEML